MVLTYRPFGLTAGSLANGTSATRYTHSVTPHQAGDDEHVQVPVYAVCGADFNAQRLYRRGARSA